MKKTFSLMLVIFVLFNLCACNNSNTSGKVGVITKEELAQYSEYIELTTENWSEYFEITRKESVTTDIFGEEKGTSVYNHIVLKDGCYISEDNAVRIKYNIEQLTWDGVTDGGKLIEIEWTDDIVFEDTMIYGEDMSKRGRSLHPDLVGDVTCEKIKGTILKLSIPDEKWAVDDEGRKYIEVKDSGYSTMVYYCYKTINYNSFVGE